MLPNIHACHTQNASRAPLKQCGWSLCRLLQVQPSTLAMAFSSRATQGSGSRSFFSNAPEELLPGALPLLLGAVFPIPLPTSVKFGSWFSLVNQISAPRAPPVLLNSKWSSVPESIHSSLLPPTEHSILQKVSVPCFLPYFCLLP